MVENYERGVFKEIMIMNEFNDRQHRFIYHHHQLSYQMIIHIIRKQIILKSIPTNTMCHVLNIIQVKTKFCQANKTN